MSADDQLSNTAEADSAAVHRLLASASAARQSAADLEDLRVSVQRKDRAYTNADRLVANTLRKAAAALKEQLEVVSVPYALAVLEATARLMERPSRFQRRVALPAPSPAGKVNRRTSSSNRPVMTTSPAPNAKRTVAVNRSGLIVGDFQTITAAANMYKVQWADQEGNTGQLYGKLAEALRKDDGKGYFELTVDGEVLVLKHPQQN